MAVVVLGSINMDLVVRVKRLPQPGETITGQTFFTAPGGKGANQAVAAARLGARTRMVGRVGGDVFGGALRESLSANGVEVSGVVTDERHPSGVAVIAVDERAENSIVIVPGANGAVGGEDVARLSAALEGATVLMLQLETPLHAAQAAARAARASGVTVILDPAPAVPLPAEFYRWVDIITPNETEASLLTGLTVESEADAKRAAQALGGGGAKNVVIKLGARGAYFWDGAEGTMLPPFRVQAVDTVAAGDAFNGGLACALDAGLPLDGALRWGMAAGALSTTRLGAQPSMPDRAALMKLLQTDTAT